MVFHHPPPPPPPPPQPPTDTRIRLLGATLLVHVTEEGNESGLFSLTDSTSENNSEEAQGEQRDPNNTVITENS